MVQLKQLSTLVSALELRNLVKTQSFLKQYRVVEAGLGKAALQNYNQGHISDHAVFLDTLECTQPTSLIPRNLPDIKCFQDYVSDLGISNAHHLIIYDRSPFGFYTSSRMWWTFRLFGHEKVSILNGGLNSWVRHGFELSSQTPNFNKENFFIINENKELKRNFDQIKANKKTQLEQVVDVRGEDDFNRAHIPNSQNVPYNQLFDPYTGLLKSKEDLLALFKENDVNLSKPLVASCLTGMTATSFALAAYLIGLKNTSVYYGSWTEYSQRTEDN